MGDHTSETLQQQLQSRQDDEAYARDHILGGQGLCLDEDSIPWIVNHIDCFVSQSRGNQIIKRVHLCPLASFGGHEKNEWDKIGQAVGNLQALESLLVSTRHYWHVEDSPTLDWDILARISSHARQRIALAISTHPVWRAGDIRSFAGAIRGQPTITSFDSCYNLPCESMDALYSALVTLPALESVRLSSSSELLTRAEDESALAYPESLTELLRAPSLRSVYLEDLDFTTALCQATANAFMKGTVITKLEFIKCSFPDGECATILASGLSRNTSVASIQVVSPFGRVPCDALAAALPLNSTLRHLILDRQDSDGAIDLSPFFSALGKNTGLKTLIVCGIGLMEESLCTAIKDGLGLNETLESLELNDISIFDDTVALCCRAFSFLRTSKALKSLLVDAEYHVTASCLSAFRIDMATLLQENTSLESLTIKKSAIDMKVKAEEYIALVTALQYNTTLKTLRLRNSAGSLQLTDDEDKQIASLLKKNYTLERLLDVDLENEAGDVGAILRLNEAGRWYLIEDGSSISKGVKVLSAVSNQINCVFLHLLENPTLCDRCAVEILTGAGERNDSRSTSQNASSGGGKRGQASAHESNESRRRLA
jgi:hypothetical protein